MTWTIQPITRFAEFAGPWDELVRSRPGTPFLETAFLQPLVDIFGTGSERLCLYYFNGQLCAAAIVQREQQGMWQTFQPSQLPLGAWISAGHIDPVSACSELMPVLPGLAVGLGLSQMDSRIQARPADGPAVRTQDYIQTAWVDVDDSFDAYWEARGKNLKQNTRKQRNKLKAEGLETRTECVVEPTQVAQAIEDYGQLESAGWKSADGTAIHPANAQGRCYTKILKNFCAMGRGRIYRSWFNDKVVAMDLCVHDDEAIVILKTAYDESYKAVSPSTLMRQDEFQHLFEEKKFKRIEFYGKVMEWHTRWTANARPIYHANVYRHAVVRRLLDLRASLLKRAPQPATAAETTHA